ncbi:MAG: hypothetical protein WBE68_18540 [Candidatus Nitrosopolaris sp.]
MLTCSFPYVRNWLNEHPFRNEANARLICNLVTGGSIKVRRGSGTAIDTDTPPPHPEQSANTESATESTMPQLQRSETSAPVPPTTTEDLKDNSMPTTFQFSFPFDEVWKYLVLASHDQDRDRFWFCVNLDRAVDISLNVTLRTASEQSRFHQTKRGHLKSTLTKATLASSKFTLTQSSGARSMTHSTLYILLEEGGQADQIVLECRLTDLQKQVVRCNICSNDEPTDYYR